MSTSVRQEGVREQLLRDIKNNHKRYDRVQNISRPYPSKDNFWDRYKHLEGRVRRRIASAINSLAELDRPE